MFREFFNEGNQNPKLLTGYKKGYHIGNTFFRKDIKKQGLIPQIGPSYEAHFENKKYGTCYLLFNR